MNLFAFTALAAKETVLQTLDIFWKGMLAVAIVILVLVLVILVFTKLLPAIGRFITQPPAGQPQEPPSDADDLDH